MAPRIEIVDGQVIAKPELLLDFVAVATWNKGLFCMDSRSVADKGISPQDQFHLWIGLTAHLLDHNPPPRIEKILIAALQSLHPEFTYQSKIDRG